MTTVLPRSQSGVPSLCGESILEIARVGVLLHTTVRTVRGYTIQTHLISLPIQPPQTQVYQTQLDSFDAAPVITRISNEERDSLVSEVMRLMLFSQYKDGAPVLKADIAKLLSSLSPVRGLTSYIIAKSQLKFMEIFGYEMKELERTVAKKTGANKHVVDKGAFFFIP